MRGSGWIEHGVHTLVVGLPLSVLRIPAEMSQDGADHRTERDWKVASEIGPVRGPQHTIGMKLHGPVLGLDQAHRSPRSGWHEACRAESATGGNGLLVFSDVPGIPIRSG